MFPGHEYTEMLLQLACRREVHNEAARSKLVQVRQLRAKKLPTIPSTIEEELKYNPFIRATVEELMMLTNCRQIE